MNPITLRKVGTKTNQVVEHIAGFVLLMMTIIVAVSVFLRYIFGITAVWTDEAVRYLFIYIIFLGASSATKNNKQIKLDLFRFSARKEKARKFVIHLFILFFLAITIKESIPLIASVGGELTAGLRVPIGLFYSALPVGCGIMAIWTAGQIIKLRIEAFGLPEQTRLPSSERRDKKE